ncbi:MAG: YdcH family protein [Gammaproteobacteria bacterium]
MLANICDTGFVRPDYESMANSTFQEIRVKLEGLRLEHRDLDIAISHLADDIHTNELQLKRLKKRKLQLKDYIAKLESLLIPDLDA